ncbi:hypothetical protein FCV25MIE_35092 [Fagus crenata]
MRALQGSLSGPFSALLSSEAPSLRFSSGMHPFFRLVPDSVNSNKLRAQQRHKQQAHAACETSASIKCESKSVHSTGRSPKGEAGRMALS